MNNTQTSVDLYEVSFRATSSKFQRKLKKRARRGKRILPEPTRVTRRPQGPVSLELGSVEEVIRYFPEVVTLCGEPPWEDEGTEVLSRYHSRVWETLNRLIVLHGS